MPITALPDPPNRTDGHDAFVEKANAHVAALGLFTEEANTLAETVNTKEASAVNAANMASASAEVAMVAGNFKGAWVDLTGTAAIPYSVYHDGDYWQLLTNLADITASEPGVSGDWVLAGARTLTGEIIMWPLNTPPGDCLMCDGAIYDYDIYPALGALLGGAPGGQFNVPNINFAKNSKGSDTGTLEDESVGTHGHTANAVGNHGHTVSVNSAGGHTHSTGGGTGSSTVVSSAAPRNISSYYGSATGSAGAHGHSASAGSAGGHTPIIQNHDGVNQPACTLINFCIRT